LADFIVGLALVFGTFDAGRCKVASLVVALAINGFGVSKTCWFDSVVAYLMPKSIPTAD